MSGSDSFVGVSPSVVCWERLSFWLVSLLALMPLWLPAFPPMADLPQHAAQVALFRDLLTGSSTWGDLLAIKWFTPYILGYLFTIALAEIFGVVAACKLTVSVSLLSILFVTRYLLHKMQSEVTLAWLCFFCLYGFVYQWGMISFMLAVPAGLYFIRVLCWHEEKPDVGRGTILAVYFVVLFFCHALVLAYCFAVAAVFWLGGAPWRGSTRSLFEWMGLRLWPLLGVLILAVLWLSRSSTHASVSVPVQWDLGWWQATEGYYNSATWVFEHFVGWGRVAGLFPWVLGLRSGAIAIVLGMLLLAVPFLLGQRVIPQRARVTPFLTLMLCLLLVPSFVFGTAFVFHRYAILFFPLYVLMFGRTQGVAVNPLRRMRLNGLVAVAVVIWITLFSVKAVEFNRAALAFREVTDQVPRDARVLSLVFYVDDENSIAPTLLHFPTWLSTTRGSLVDAGFTGTHIQLVAYRSGMLPKASVVDYFEWRPHLFDWQLHQGDHYDHFVVRSPTDVSSWLFRAATCPPKLVAARLDWWLYVRDEECRK